MKKDKCRISGDGDISYCLHREVSRETRAQYVYLTKRKSLEVYVEVNN